MAQNKVLTNVLPLIRQKWKESITQYHEGKVWESEKDIIAIFYHLLRPDIDQFIDYELFWEWKVKQSKRKKMSSVDLGLAEVSQSTNNNMRAFLRIAMEFKFIGILSKENKKRIQQDFNKLGQLLQEGDLADKNRKPDYAFLFIIDSTKQPNLSFYSQFTKGSNTEVYVYFPQSENRESVEPR